MAKHKQEDPWAGFVDVLSSILMVIIFLVVILGIAIFGISQKVTQVAVENAIKAEREKQPSADDPAEKPSPSRDVEKADAPPVAMLAPDADKSMPSPEAKDKNGRFEAINAPSVRSHDSVEGKNALSVRSVAVSPTKTIEIASEEAQNKEEQKAEIVKSSNALFALKFKTGSYRIDGSSAQEMCKHMGGDLLAAASTLEIRSIARTGNDSISDARRIAYYRGMQTRTELIKCGVAEIRIAVKLREADQGEEGDSVQVFVKP